ncbi:uracil-DNA glycosylase [Ureibacillus xyleni]|uniref:uracil-DNA glycosylase n=1 Tax=Ureibacillus xyleni TaxID=614648 RepID=UPI000BE3CEF0|nr:uracil-DNA glycosylase [Ureibacillus xyleni]
MKVSCFKCQHFRVTWDQNNPRGCAAYQFKSKQLPSIIVKQSSGMDCMQFSPKQTQEDRR